MNYTTDIGSNPTPITDGSNQTPMGASTIRGTLVALGTPTAYDANGQEYEQLPRALVHVTEEEVRALGPNFVGQPVVIVPADKWQAVQDKEVKESADTMDDLRRIHQAEAKLARVERLRDEWDVNTKSQRLRYERRMGLVDGNEMRENERRVRELTRALSDPGAEPQEGAR